MASRGFVRRIAGLALALGTLSCTSLLPGSDVLRVDDAGGGDGADGAEQDAAAIDGGDDVADAGGDAGLHVCPAAGTRGTRVLTNEEFAGDTHLTCDFDYELEGYVVVSSGTLRIDPGVTVRARANAFLLIGRGARIEAEGTADEPIVFTAKDRPSQPGAWRGVFLLGAADTALPNSATLGLPSGDARGFFGGTDDEHDCGVLRHVRIEFAGGGTNEYDFPGAALTLAGCGRKTRVDALHVHGATDGLGLIGGTAPLKRVLVTAAAADGIEWAAGYRGFLQFVVVQSFVGAGAALKGARLENDQTSAPASAPVIDNATLVGASVRGLPSGPVDPNGFETGVQLQAGTALTLRNALVLGFPGAWVDVIGDATAQLVVAGTTRIESTIFFDGTARATPPFPGAGEESGGEDDDGGLDEDAQFRAAGLQNRFPVSGFALFDPVAAPPARPRFATDGFVDGGSPADAAPAGWDEVWEPAYYAGALPKIPSASDGALDWTCGEVACAWTSFPEE